MPVPWRWYCDDFGDGEAEVDKGVEVPFGDVLAFTVADVVFDVEYEPAVGSEHSPYF